MNAALRHSSDGVDLLWLWCPGCEDLHAVRIGEWTWDGNVIRPTIGPSILVRRNYWEPPVTAENLEAWKREPWEQHQVERVCHSFVVDGVWQFLGDSTHALAGQHVPMTDVEPQWPDGFDTPQEA